MAKSKIGVDFIIDDKGNIRKIGDAAEKTGRKVGKLGENSRTADRNIKGVASASANATKNFSKMGQGMGGLVGLYATFAANVFALTAVFGFLKDVGDLAALERGQVAYFMNTGTSMKFLAKEMQAATGGLLAFRDAAQAGAIGKAAGLSNQQLKDIAILAKNASVTLGRDLTDSFNRLTRGIIKAEPELLDELGIIIRLDRVMKDYAASINRTVGELSQFERSQAVANAVLDQGSSKFEDVGNNINQTAKALKVFNELLDDLKRTLAPVVESVAVGLIDSLKAAEDSAYSIQDVLAAVFGGLAIKSLLGRFAGSLFKIAKDLLPVARGGGVTLGTGFGTGFLASARALIGPGLRVILGLAVGAVGSIAGAPTVALLTALGAGYYYFTQQSDNATESQKDFARTLRELNSAQALYKEEIIDTYSKLEEVDKTVVNLRKHFEALGQAGFENLDGLIETLEDTRASDITPGTKKGGLVTADYNNIELALEAINNEMFKARDIIDKMSSIEEKVGLPDGASTALLQAIIRVKDLDHAVEKVRMAFARGFEDPKSFEVFQENLEKIKNEFGGITDAMINLNAETKKLDGATKGLSESFENHGKALSEVKSKPNVYEKQINALNLMKNSLKAIGKFVEGTVDDGFGLPEETLKNIRDIVGDIDEGETNRKKIQAAITAEIEKQEKRQKIMLTAVTQAQIAALDAEKNALSFQKERIKATNAVNIATAKQQVLQEKIAEAKESAGTSEQKIDGKTVLVQNINSTITGLQEQLGLSKAQLAILVKKQTYENKESVKLARRNIDALNFDQKRLSIIESIESVERRIAKIKINDLNRIIAETERKRADDIQAVELSGKGDVQRQFALEKINRAADIAVLEKRKSIIEEEKLAKLEALTREEEMLTLKYDLQINELTLMKEIDGLSKTRIDAIEQLITRLQDAKKGLSGDDGTIEGLKGDVKDDAESKTKDIDSQIERSRKAQREIMDINQLSQSATNSLADGMGQALGDLMTGTSSFKDAFKNMAKSVLADITRMIAKQLVLRALFGPSGQGGIMSIFSKKDGGIIHAANGGIFKTARNYEYGGVARGPTRGHPAILHGTEAVVPLPNNREIPVEMKGMPAQSGDTTNVSINVNSDGSMSTSGDPGQGEALGQLLARAVQQELQNQKRSGGILSPNGVA